MKLPFPFKNTDTITPSWPWPSCGSGSPKTHSFRAGNDVFMTVNSACAVVAESTAVEDTGGDAIETVIRGLWSERLFFEPVETSSILEVVKTDEFPYKETTEIMGVDSHDPYEDFKKSMEEMVEAHGMKDWKCLEELLSWYLRVNGKSNHGYIVVAFVDLLIGLAFSSSDEGSIDIYDHSTTTTTTSPFSFSSCTTSTSPCLSSLVEAEDETEKSVHNCSSSSSSSSSDV